MIKPRHWPRLNSSPLEAKNPGFFCGSAATFHLWGSSKILQDKVRKLGTLVLCSPSEHAFCCTLLTLQWACAKQVRRHALWFRGDLIWLMADTLLGIYTDLSMDPPGSSDGKASAYNAGHLGSIPGSGKSPGEGNSNPLQHFAWKIPWMEEPCRL